MAGRTVNNKAGGPVTDHARVAADNDIELAVAAKAEHLPVIRAVTANLAMRADFDVDAISDLELAVDEACSELIVRAAPDATLRCRFTVAGDAIRFTASAAAAQQQTPSTTSFGWRILTTLTDDVASRLEPADGDIRLLHIDLAKRRRVGPE